MTGEEIVETEKEVRVQYTSDRVGALVPLGSIIQLTGPSAGEELEGTELERGQLVKLTPPEGLINPTKYQIILSWHPQLAEYGTVQAPPMVPPGAEYVSIVFRPHKKVDLEQFEYIFHLYMID